MANSNVPFGFQVFQTEGKEHRVRKYPKTASAVIYPGDTVKRVAAGTVEVAAAGDAFIGVAAEYSSASMTADVAVYDDPETVFIAQVSANYVDPTDDGQNANIVATTGDTTLLRSKHTVDSSSFATTSTLQWRIVGMLNRGANESGSYAIIRVKPNNHVFKGGVAGI